ncbi:PREDICTED: uncharacterized protein LOC106319619 [Brassica oleracea var. oleracea]|uniref:uncharacterized protein LOC106319619 n=1 Tax=Brassica oleracea var. oleracea TaxID=109376 RepID=UPI0006A71AC0|nr:PREDICTED: uncharacterized protein LOC106319619 [Brassica oleracea var. oleracea]
MFKCSPLLLISSKALLGLCFFFMLKVSPFLLLLFCLKPFTLIVGGEQLPPQASSLQQLLQIGLTAILHASYVCCRSPRGMTLPKLCPNVCKVVVMTREQELLLCRGDVSNSSPSRLKRMLQSLTGMPSATFEGIVTVKTETFFFFAYVC